MYYRIFRTNSTITSRPFVSEYYKIPSTAFGFITTSDDVINMHAYIAGFVAKKLLKSAINCAQCRRHILSRDCDIDEFHKLIELKEFNSERRALLYPMRSFVNTFGHMTDFSDLFLPRICLENGVSRLLKEHILEYVSNTFLHCVEHGKSNVRSVRRHLHHHVHPSVGEGS